MEDVTGTLTCSAAPALPGLGGQVSATAAPARPRISAASPRECTVTTGLWALTPENFSSRSVSGVCAGERVWAVATGS